MAFLRHAVRMRPALAAIVLTIMVATAACTNASLVCETASNTCVQCATSADCTTNAAPVCVTNACVACTSNAQCGAKSTSLQLCA